MNNSQFRKLVLENSTPRPDNGAQTTARPSATPFGAKARGFMTPRHTKDNSSSVDFRKQLLEQSADKQRKKFRSAAAPKGTKLAAGYLDRTQSRQDEDNDDKAKRVKALEESMKLGQIDEATFFQLRDQITGGDIGSTHLVKGLDRQLLARVKRGEDVLNPTKQEESEEEAEEDIEGALDRLGDESVVAPVVREKTVKRGEMAPPPPVAGVKRDRNTLLAELRASRAAVAEAKAAGNTKFRKIGEKKESMRLEVDDKGREVMTITDAEGNIKRKVRKTKAEDEAEMPKDAEVFGADVILPETALPQPVVEEEEDEDIFAGAGTDYNPFGVADADDDDSSASEDDGEIEDTRPKSKAATSGASPKIETQPPPALTENTPKAKRNYFDDDPEDTQDKSFNPLQDPTILAALRKSRDVKLKPEVDPEEEARQKKRAAMLASSNRDFEDMDMGFGSSKFADEEEMEGGDDIKLSEWGRGDDDDGDGKGGKKQRKRGPKKKKGDKNNAADIMKVMDSRKKD